MQELYGAAGFFTEAKDTLKRKRTWVAAVNL